MRWVAVLMIAGCTGGEPEDTDTPADTDMEDTDVQDDGIAEGTWATANEATTADGCNLYDGDDDAYGAPATFTVTRTDAGFDVFAQEWEDRSTASEATESDGTLVCTTEGDGTACEGRVAYWDFRPDSPAEMSADVTWTVTLDGNAAMTIAMDETLDCTGADCNGIAYWAGVDFPCTTSHTFDATGP